MKTQNARDQWFMAGTEGTGEYIVLLITALGRIGYRLLAFNEARVRVEPVSAEAAEQMRGHFGAGWKQPGQDGQQRFSRVVAGGENLKVALATAITAMAEESDSSFEVNPAAEQWALEIILQVKDMFKSVKNSLAQASDEVVEVDDNAVCNEGEVGDGSTTGYTVLELTAMTKPKLIELAKSLGLKTRKLNKFTLVDLIIAAQEGTDEVDESVEENAIEE